MSKVEKYSLVVQAPNRSTDRRTDMTIVLVHRDEGQAQNKFKKVPVAFIIENDGSIRLLKEPGQMISVSDFGYPSE